MRAVSFSALRGWAQDDHCAAFAAFLKSAEHIGAAPRNAAGAGQPGNAPKTRAHGISGSGLCAVARSALAAKGQGLASDPGRARAFFERWFRPMRIVADGFFTAYFEPEAPASRTPTSAFPVPLYRRPADLVDVGDHNRPAGWDPDIRFAAKSANGLEPYADRAAIEGGALEGRGLELAYVADPVTAFFIHVQGSARLRFSDGTTLRIAYAGKSGHPYTSIGKRAVACGYLHPDRCGKTELQAWLAANPGPGRDLMHENRSFIFFRPVNGLSESDGPVGAGAVSLTPGRSLAVDRRWTTFHTPVWIDAAGVPDPDDRPRETRNDAPVGVPDDIQGASRGGRFARLMVAQDTGSAIVGPARGDLFFGAGERAGDLAGTVRAPGEMTLLVPVPEG